MKRMPIAVVLLLIISTIPIYGQEEDLSQVESEIELKLLYKKEFGELMVGPEGFPPPEIKQILKDNDIPQEDKDWLLNSLRIEIARKEKVLYTNDGKTIQLPDDLQSIWTSKNLKYMVTYAAHYDWMGMSSDDVRNVRTNEHNARKKSIEWGMKWEEAGHAQDYTYIDSVRYWCHVRDSLGALDASIQRNTRHIKKVIFLETETGRVLWQKDGWVNTFDGTGDDVMPPSFVSDDGKTSAAIPGYGGLGHLYNTVIFYDERGSEKKALTDLYGRRGCHDLSADGEIFYTLTQSSRDDTTTLVAAFGNDGRERWQAGLGSGWPAFRPCIAVSQNNRFVVASTGGTSLFTDRGALIDTYKFRTYKPAFSSDDRYVMLGYPRDTVYFVQTDNGDILWKKSLGGQPYSKPFVAKGGRAIFYTDGYLLDSNGNIVWQDKNGVRNTLGLSPSGYLFIPTTNPDVLIYHLSLEAVHEDQ
ncbi:PQQ-like beta-propeller repeat protein [candidate division WOR-3 bacterium]|nr:PQQ-like beta-propeller repeat protein [candidate division WOR-3 bacterium]